MLRMDRLEASQMPLKKLSKESANGMRWAYMGRLYVEKYASWKNAAERTLKFMEQRLRGFSL